MRVAVVVALLSLPACERDLVHELSDAPADAMDGCPAPSQPLVAGQYLLYLNTEGVTLDKGSPSSATNTSDLVVASGTVVPPFLSGVPGRDAYIAQVVSIAQDALAPYSIDVVTTRPASRTYYMFVLGGDPVMIVGGCQDCASTTDSGCGNILPRNEVDLMFDHGMPAPGPVAYAGTLLSDIGTIAGLVPTTDPNDCMCRVDTGCTFGNAVCSFGSAAPTTAQSGSGGPLNCGRTPTQDEPRIMAAAMGCR